MKMTEDWFSHSEARKYPPGNEALAHVWEGSAPANELWLFLLGSLQMKSRSGPRREPFPAATPGLTCPWFPGEVLSS